MSRELSNLNQDNISPYNRRGNLIETTAREAENFQNLLEEEVNQEDFNNLRRYDNQLDLPGLIYLDEQLEEESVIDKHIVQEEYSPDHSVLMKSQGMSNLEKYAEAYANCNETSRKEILSKIDLNTYERFLTEVIKKSNDATFKAQITETLDNYKLFLQPNNGPTTSSQAVREIVPALPSAPPMERKIIGFRKDVPMFGGLHHEDFTQWLFSINMSIRTYGFNDI